MDALSELFDNVVLALRFEGASTHLMHLADGIMRSQAKIYEVTGQDCSCSPAASEA